MRRTLIVIGIVISLLLIAGIIYFVFFSSSTPHLTTVGSAGSPFNDTNAGTAAVNPTEPANEVAGNAGTVVAPDFVEITSSPVSAGEVAFDIAPATSTASVGSTTSVTATQGDIEVHYIDRESGNVYAYQVNARSLTRISDKTLPGIQQASWVADGSMAIVRFLTENNGSEQLETYALPTDGSDGYFFPEGLDEATVVGSSTVFTLDVSTDNSVGVVQNSDGSNPQQIFTSPLSSIIVYGAGKGYVAVTKAASEVDGYAFTINPNGSFTPILGPLLGLTILPSPSGKSILFSYTDGTNFHMGVLDLATGSITTLPIATIAEKCVWTSDETTLYCAIPSEFSGNLPDDWYQGAVSFTDRIWEIDLVNHLATLVLDPRKTGNVLIDAVNLTLDPQSQVLVFRNKKDSSLWAYKL